MILQQISNLIQITEANIIEIGKKLGKHLLNIKDSAIMGHYDGKTAAIDSLLTVGKTHLYPNHEEIRTHNHEVASIANKRRQDRGNNNDFLEHPTYTLAYMSSYGNHYLDPQHRIKLGLAGAGAIGTGIHKYYKGTTDDSSTDK